MALKIPFPMFNTISRKLLRLASEVGSNSILRSRVSLIQDICRQPENIFVMDRRTHAYVRKPTSLKPSACTPLFLAAFEKGAGCCIHTHSQWAVLVTLLVEKAAEQNGKSSANSCFEIEMIEQIKGIPKGKNKPGMLGYFDRLRVPIIENTAQYGTRFAESRGSND